MYKQELALIIAAALLFVAAGTMETMPLVSFGCLTVMGAVIGIGRLHKRTTSIKQIQRDYKL